jgi:hypothetical protein
MGNLELERTSLYRENLKKNVFLDRICNGPIQNLGPFSILDF